MDIQSKLFETVLEIEEPLYIESIILYASKDFFGLTHVGVDEASSRKGHKYVNVFVDMIKREVVYTTLGKDESAIARFSDELSCHNSSSVKITNVSMVSSFYQRCRCIFQKCRDYIRQIPYHNN